MERDEIIRTANLRAESIAEETKAKAAAEADAIIAKARQDIENEKKRAIVDLRNEIANLSIGIAQRLIESELSDRQKADDIIRRELQEAHLN
jgi:F-type H+-transporting ATPase subunit b